MRATYRFLNLVLIPVLLAGLFLIPTTPAGASPAADPFSPSARQVMAALPPGGMATFIVTLRDQLAAPPAAGAALSPLQAAAAQPTKAARQQAVILALQSYAASQQAGFMAQAGDLQAQGQVGRLIPFWIFNGISIQATPAAIQALAARPEVLSITPDPDPAHPIRPLDDLAPAASAAAQGRPAAPSTLTPEPNIELVNAPAMWAMGYTGQGIVIASLDTGVEATHPDLAASYRGGTNSWYDPYGQNATPFDSYGHGTLVMGIMVGGGDPAAPGLIGMAPGAKWISAKIFDNSGNSTDTAVHQAFQWVMNPNNNPANTGAPDVVNNSWGGSGCVLTFQLDVTALRAADILPVFSAGNYGPNPGTDSFPANNPGAFAVGAINNLNNIASFSSRGPNSCNATTFPQLVAPGVNIETSYRGGVYDNLLSGTSFAAPHVSGALALLLSAMPYLTPDQQEQALIHGAAPLGTTPPNNTFGNGRLDVLASFNWLNEINAPLKIPAGLSAAAASATQIDLSWTDSNNGGAQYEISRSPDKKTWTPLTTTAAGASAYSDTSGLTGDTRYYYRVRAVQGGMLSQYAGVSAVTQVDALRPPTGLVASPAQTIRIDVSWVNNSATANYVEIQRSPTGLNDGKWVTLSNTLPPTTTLYSDSAGLVENTTYYYQVRARNTALGMDSTFAGPAQATVPLLAPTGLVATAVGPSQVNLSWTDHSAAATGYEVQRSLTGVGGWTLLNTLGPGAQAYIDNDSVNLSEGGLYFYQVRAVGSAGAASTYASANTRTLLKAPTSLAAAAVSPTQVNLSWVNTSSLAAGIKIQRSTDALTWDPLITLGSAATTYNDTSGLSEGTHYYYQVQAVSAGLASAFVNADAVTPLLPPSSLAAVAVSANRIDLRWSNNSLAATGMELQRSPDGVTGWTTIFFSSTSPIPSAYSDTQVTPGATFYYQVRATGAAANSAYTSPVHVPVAPYWIYTVIMFK